MKTALYRAALTNILWWVNKNIGYEEDDEIRREILEAIQVMNELVKSIDLEVGINVIE